MNRSVFFAEIRRTLFKGKMTSTQVQGITFIFDVWDKTVGKADIRFLAYCLATTFHETATTMLPIKERGGHDYFKSRYDIQGSNPKLAKALGNIQPGDGARFAGRGYVQLTGRDNYKRASKAVEVDLVASPDAAMNPEVAAEIMFAGMQEGWFTGRTLARYFNAETNDPVNARKIINGLDKADMIAGYHQAFLGALLKAAL